MPDLYAVLDVAKDAAKDLIRKAYRKKAKTMHPDAGGTPEKFALVRLAHDILGDDERRKKYDATGDCSETTVDNSITSAWELLASAFQTALNEMNQRREDMFKVDIARRIEGVIKGKIEEIQRTKADAAKARATAEKMVGRFKLKQKRGQPPPVNYLDRLMRDKMAEIGRAIEQMDAQIATHERALEMAKSYEFEHDPEITQVRMMRMNTTSTTW